MNNIFLVSARAAEQGGDYLAARMNYLKCVEDMKRSGASQSDIQAAASEYEGFVKRDPIFAKLISVLIPLLKAQPGMIQSELGKQLPSVDWAALYDYNRPVTKEDVYYALYFGEKVGRIRRVKKGRSYELFAME